MQSHAMLLGLWYRVGHLPGKPTATTRVHEQFRHPSCASPLWQRAALWPVFFRDLVGRYFSRNNLARWRTSLIFCAGAPVSADGSEMSRHGTPHAHGCEEPCRSVGSSLCRLYIAAVCGMPDQCRVFFWCSMSPSRRRYGSLGRSRRRPLQVWLRARVGIRHRNRHWEQEPALAAGRPFIWFLGVVRPRP